MKHILLVDDDIMNSMVAKHALGTEYTVTSVCSGKEALDFLEKQAPDIILMDIEMPEMDGKTVVRNIKAHDAWNKIPVVFLTADSSPITEADCLQCGADDFITNDETFEIYTTPDNFLKVKEAMEEILSTLLEKRYNADKFVQYKKMYKEMTIGEYFEFIKTLE